ncbi:MAG: hypothetical protein ACLFNA_06005 [Halochromatium sp.]
MSERREQGLELFSGQVFERLTELLAELGKQVGTLVLRNRLGELRE